MGIAGDKVDLALRPLNTSLFFSFHLNSSEERISLS